VRDRLPAWRPPTPDVCEILVIGRLAYSLAHPLCNLKDLRDMLARNGWFGRFFGATLGSDPQLLKESASCMSSPDHAWR
jgi:hypothetical protein